VQDTAYAPAGDMFEIGARVQVAKRGLFFPARANKLYELYQRYNSLDEIDPKTRQQIQERYFKRSFEAVWDETRAYYARVYPSKLAEIEKSPKQRMSLIFRWYFVHSTRLAMSGSDEQKVDYQIHCGPAMGAFNQWVKGTELQSWKNRHVADIGLRIMRGAADILNKQLLAMVRDAPAQVRAPNHHDAVWHGLDLPGGSQPSAVS
jgi:trans-AT polyketide synthase/acyltransferase/oxidoreductase domain-containing protein